MQVFLVSAYDAILSYLKKSLLKISMTNRTVNDDNHFIEQQLSLNACPFESPYIFIIKSFLLVFILNWISKILEKNTFHKINISI